MNILLLTTHLNPGGISRYTLNLSRGLSDRGHKVWVASSGGAWVKDLESKGVGHKQITLGTKSICSPKIFLAYRSLRKFMAAEKIEIIHSNTRVAQFLGFLLCRCSGTPYLSAFHGFHKPRFFRKVFKFPGLRTIAVSKSVKKYLIEGMGIAESQVRVVYNGIEEAEFLKPETSRNDWGFGPKDYLLGILGRISEEKGHFLAAEAVKKLSVKYPNIYLLISGKGRLEEDLKSRVKDIKIQERVKFIQCPASQFLAIIDLLLMPSSKEGFGYSVVEAFVKKIPVVGYNVGGISEIIADRINGILFFKYEPSALAAAIEEVMTDKPLREKIVANAKRDSSFYSCARMAADTEKIYREILT